MGDETRQVRETRWFSNRGLTRQAVRRRMSAELSVKLRKCLYKKQGHTATNNICRQNCSNWGNICTKKQSYSPQVNSCCILSLCTVNYLFRCQKDAESETTCRYQFQKTIRWNIITQSYSLHRRSPCFWEHFVHFVPYGSTLYIRNIYIYIVFILYYIIYLITCTLSATAFLAQSVSWSSRGVTLKSCGREFHSHRRPRNTVWWQYTLRRAIHKFHVKDRSRFALRKCSHSLRSIPGSFRSIPDSFRSISVRIRAFTFRSSLT